MASIVAIEADEIAEEVPARSSLGRVRRGSTAAGACARGELERADSASAGGGRADHLTGGGAGGSGARTRASYGCCTASGPTGSSRSSSRSRRGAALTVTGGTSSACRAGRTGSGAGCATSSSICARSPTGSSCVSASAGSSCAGSRTTSCSRAASSRSGSPAPRRRSAANFYVQGRFVPARPVLRPVRARDDGLLEAERLAGRRPRRHPRDEPAAAARPGRVARLRARVGFHCARSRPAGAARYPDRPAALAGDRRRPRAEDAEQCPTGGAGGEADAGAAEVHDADAARGHGEVCDPRDDR